MNSAWTSYISDRLSSLFILNSGTILRCVRVERISKPIRRNPNNCKFCPQITSCRLDLTISLSGVPHTVFITESCGRFVNSPPHLATSPPRHPATEIRDWLAHTAAHTARQGEWLTSWARQVTARTSPPVRSSQSSTRLLTAGALSPPPPVMVVTFYLPAHHICISITDICIKYYR